MGTNFGMSSFVGKMVAIIGDMRIGSKCDKDLLAENVLKLTGRSLFTFDRKNQSHWTGYLPCKLWMISNERPTLKDSSGALASRFIIYQTRTSWMGREDTNFFRDKLKPELPAILLWALEGLKRIRANNRITETKCSAVEREILARDASPVLAFIAECLTYDNTASIDKDEMHMAFCKWAEAAGIYSKPKSVFMRDLKSATGGKLVAGRAPETAGKRTPIIHGVRFKRTTDMRATTEEIPF
jgi:putative DNA primase/helicase